MQVFEEAETHGGHLLAHLRWLNHPPAHRGAPLGSALPRFTRITGSERATARGAYKFHAAGWEVGDGHFAVKLPESGYPGVLNVVNLSNLTAPEAGAFRWRVLPTCGDGVTGACEACGDGITAGEEGCDDRNSTGGDGCSADCEIEDGWSCAGVPAVCAETCGDGLVVGDEGCDDQNTAGGDGCSSTCIVEDADGDGVNDGDDNCPEVPNPGQENHYRTDAGDACEDSDGDHLLDSDEDLNANGILDPGETSPASVDTDGDGLCDGPVIGTVPCSGAEDANTNGRVDWGETDPSLADTDGGGVSDGEEVTRGTDPLNPLDDTAEVQGGTLFGCSMTNGQVGEIAPLLAMAGLVIGLAARRRNRHGDGR